jgi:hypothetical protein
MTWQDILLTIGSILLLVALLPSVRAKDKPIVTTSLLTGTVLFVFAIIYASLDLWFSAAITVLTSTTWLVLAYQKARQRRKK